MLVNVRDRASTIADTLMRYYGDQTGYLAASLCAYETFLTKEETCPFPNGQASENGTSIELSNPFPFLDRDRNASSSSITFGSTVRFLVDAADRVVADLDETNDDIVRKIVRASDSASGTVSRCSPDILLCQRRKMSIANAAWIAESWAVAIFFSFKLVGITSVGLGAFLTAQVTLIPSAVLSMAYDYSMSCLPRLPVCVMDDFFAVLRAAFPAHVDWSTLVENPERTRHPEFTWLHTLDGGDTKIVNCREQGFDDQLDAYFWLTGKIGWREVTAIVDWPPRVPVEPRETQTREMARSTARPSSTGAATWSSSARYPSSSSLFFLRRREFRDRALRQGWSEGPDPRDRIDRVFFLAALALYNR